MCTKRRASKPKSVLNETWISTCRNLNSQSHVFLKHSRLNRHHRETFWNAEWNTASDSPYFQLNHLLESSVRMNNLQESELARRLHIRSYKWVTNSVKIVGRGNWFSISVLYHIHVRIFISVCTYFHRSDYIQIRFKSSNYLLCSCATASSITLKCISQSWCELDWTNRLWYSYSHDTIWNFKENKRAHCLSNALDKSRMYSNRARIVNALQFWCRPTLTDDFASLGESATVGYPQIKTRNRSLRNFTELFIVGRMTEDTKYGFNC